MDKNLAVAIIFSVISISGMIYGIVYTIFQAKKRQPDVPPRELTSMNERIGRIEQAVDAIAMEVERIGEGQRFTTKLLAERGDAVSVARDNR